MTQNRSSNIYRLSRKVIFQWVPSYVGLEGNEIADKLAKKKGYYFTYQRNTHTSGLTEKSLESQNSYAVQT